MNSAICERFCLNTVNIITKKRGEVLEVLETVAYVAGGYLLCLFRRRHN